MKEGIDFKYGARHLKRAVERFLVYPLSNLVATGQIGLGDLVFVGTESQTQNGSYFRNSRGGALIADMPETPAQEKSVWRPDPEASGLPIPQVKETKAAKKGQGRGERAES